MNEPQDPNLTAHVPSVPADSLRATDALGYPVPREIARGQTLGEDLK